jgi:hypothetical protein
VQPFRTLTESRERLGVSDRSLGVLKALLSFQPETALALPRPRAATTGADDGIGEGASGSRDLVVFPSNHQLGQRGAVDRDRRPERRRSHPRRRAARPNLRSASL